MSLMGHLADHRPLCVVVKHEIPAVGIASTVEEAFRRVWEGDSTAAFGGVVILDGRHLR